MKDIDVTDKVEFGKNDGEFLPLMKCVCGKLFGYWDCVLSIYETDANECPNCMRKLYFRSGIKVYEVIE